MRGKVALAIFIVVIGFIEFLLFFTDLHATLTLRPTGLSPTIYWEQFN